MIAYQCDYLRAHIVTIQCVNVQPIEEAFSRGDACFLVSTRAPAAFEKFSGRRLAEIMSERGEHHSHLLGIRQVIDQFACAINDQSCVNKDIAFWMPNRI